MKKFFSLFLILLIICSFESCNLITENSEQENFIGDTQSVENWDITINSADITSTINGENRITYQPNIGNKFMVISVTVKNNGIYEKTFLPLFSLNPDIVIKIVYQEKEYRASSLTGISDDLVYDDFEPSSSKTGIIVFEIPDDASDNCEDYELIFESKDERYLFRLNK